MVKLFGGLLWQNLFFQDANFHLQMGLWRQGLVSGFQVLLPHPKTISGITQERVIAAFAALPSGCDVFIHGVPERDGYNPGQGADVCASFGQTLPVELKWQEFNEAGISWSVQIAQAVSRLTYKGVIHSGNGKTSQDQAARERIVRAFKSADPNSVLALEAIYPLRFKELEEFFSGRNLSTWQTPYVWEFGGTPKEMKYLLTELGSRRCLLDFSHLVVLTHQALASPYETSVLRSCSVLEKVIGDFLALPHVDVCHYSGWPENGRLGWSHLPKLLPVPPPVLQAMRLMSAVCIEIPWSAVEPETITRELGLLYEFLNN